MQSQIKSFFWFIPLLLAGISACSIESAKPVKSQALVIASDFLHEEDTVLFSDFAQKTDIQLIIRHISPDQLISEVESKGYNSGIDLVLSKNMYTQVRLNKKGILQDLIPAEDDAKTQNRYISYKHNFIGIGLDPFVFKYTSDSLQSAKRYHDLSNTPHYHTLSEAEIISFLSPYRWKANRVKTYEWAVEWNKNSAIRPEKGPWRDSMQLVLCKHSQLNSFSDSVWMCYPEGFYFPEGSGNGVYFDLMSISIIQQAEHYSDAQKFIEHCQNSGHNALLNQKLDRFPIYDYLTSRKNGPKFYPVHIDELLKYYDVLERMLDKINISKSTPKTQSN